MTTKDTGGPAFPLPETLNPNGGISTYAQFGMTLRDYFAVKAMQPLIAGRNWNHFNGTDEELIVQWAESSYTLADAMLKARGQ